MDLVKFGFNVNTLFMKDLNNLIYTMPVVLLLSWKDLFICLFIWGFTSLSTLYRSYHDG